MAFIFTPPQRAIVPSRHASTHALRSAARRRPRCCAGPMRASRTNVASVDATALAELARSADMTAGTDSRVVALHSPGRAELLRIGAVGGPYSLSWPSRASIAPLSVRNKPEDVDKVDASPTALLASTRAASPEQAQILQVRATSLLKTAVEQGDILAGVVLTKPEEVDGLGEVLVLSVHHPDSPDGACFDPEFAGADWQINRFAAVHPPLSTWQGAFDGQQRGKDVSGNPLHTVDVSALSESDLPPEHEAEEDPLLSRMGEKRERPAPGTGELAKVSDFAPKARLVLGAGALDGMVIKMRDVSGLQGNEVLRVFTVCGWNEARIQPFTIECEAPYEAGNLTMLVGANVLAASATLEVLRKGIEKLRDTNPHVVVGFGGGAALDGAKAIASLAGQSDTEVHTALETIQDAALRGEREITVRLPRAPLSSLLIVGIVGSGAELSECVLLTARVPSATPGEGTRRHSLFVTFDYPPTLKRKSDERTCIVDPRIFSPRRLNGYDAAQGALMILATGLDCLLCAAASPQTRALAEDALQHASDSVLLALREPSHSDGPARDALARASAAAALARDACGVGVICMLTVAIVDSLRDGPIDGEFRQVFARIAASVVREAGRFPALHETLFNAARICTGDAFAGTETLVLWLVRRAEDVGVPQIRALGARRERVLWAVGQLVEQGGVRNVPHPDFESVDTLHRVVKDAMDDQQFEL